MSIAPFDHVVTEHGPLVLRVLRATVGPVDADDCWQETFLAALRSYPRLRPDSNVRGWLVTIAHHKAIDHLRSRQRAPVAVAELPDPGVGTDEMAGLLDGLVGRELWSRVGRLPEKQRLAVAYRYGADLAYDEVASLLGCSEDAARRSAFEGIRRLRAVVSREDTS